MGTGAAQDWVLGGSFAGGSETAEDGIPDAFQQGLERLSRAVADAAGREQCWLERIRAGLVALLAFLDEDPQWAGSLLLEQPLEGPVVVDATRRIHAALSELLNAGRGTVIVGAELTPSTTLIAELVVTAVLSVIRSRMLNEPGRPLVALAPSLMTFIVEPYLGRGAANAELLRSDAAGGVRVSLEAKVLPVRAHPRIMGVLRLIASSPGLSSRDIELALSGKDARGSDISDVLKRLQQRGLIESTRRLRNEPNAWVLTPYGGRVLELMTASFGAADLQGQRAGPRTPASPPPPPPPGSQQGRVDGRLA